ncbi:MAG: class I SAM-dependent methyltransferase [bacterium]
MENKIETWIKTHLSCIRTTSAELTYERQESQLNLPVIYQPLDVENKNHWLDIALCSAFSYAVRGSKVILDIGPGDGWPSLRIASKFKKVIGIDPSHRRVSVQRKNAERLRIKNVEFLEMDVVQMDFSNETLDGVIAARSIEQSNNPIMALKEVYRVLRPGGKLAMIFENYDHYSPSDERDEFLWAEIIADECILFYLLKEKNPPRETKYALFLDKEWLMQEHDLRRRLNNLSEEKYARYNPHIFGISFFERLAPFVIQTKYYELSHFTSKSLQEALTEIGFINIRGFNPEIHPLSEFFDTARRENRLKSLEDAMESIGEIFGVMAVDSATPGVKDFTIAQKPNI